MAKSLKKPKRRPMSNYSKSVIRWLVFCFPIGLMMMWTDRCRWHKAVKSAVTAVIACVLAAAILPQTLPPERKRGGVETVSLTAAYETQGPVQQIGSGDDYEVYVPVYVPQATLIVQPTPTPVPIYVWCNDGGRYYHNKNCRYVKKTTPRATLQQAISAGYSPCKDCNPPKEEELY